FGVCRAPIHRERNAANCGAFRYDCSKVAEDQAAARALVAQLRCRGDCVVCCEHIVNVGPACLITCGFKHRGCALLRCRLRAEVYAEPNGVDLDAACRRQTLAHHVKLSAECGGGDVVTRETPGHVRTSITHV